MVWADGMRALLFVDKYIVPRYMVPNALSKVKLSYPNNKRSLSVTEHARPRFVGSASVRWAARHRPGEKNARTARRWRAARMACGSPGWRAGCFDRRNESELITSPPARSRAITREA